MSTTFVEKNKIAIISALAASLLYGFYCVAAPRLKRSYSETTHHNDEITFVSASEQNRIKVSQQVNQLMMTIETQLDQIQTARDAFLQGEKGAETRNKMTLDEVQRSSTVCIEMMTQVMIKIDSLVDDKEARQQLRGGRVAQAAKRMRELGIED